MANYIPLLVPAHQNLCGSAVHLMVAVNTLAPPALPPRRLVLWTELTSVFSSWNTQLASQYCLFYLKVGVLESIVDSELQVTHLQLLET